MTDSRPRTIARATSPRPNDGRIKLGAAGESKVACWYEAHGYKVVARNWRCREGELDLILSHGRTMVFCEVKTRTSELFGLPVEAVTRTKQARLRRLAARWLEEDAPMRPTDVRFDVASVLNGDISLLEGAF